jgi:uncharacterized protein YrrD
MEFEKGADVFSAEGEKVGRVERVVINPATKEVAAIVVEKGILFAEDKVVDISLVGPVTKDRVNLREFPGDLEDLPDLIESHFVPLRETDKPEEAAAPLYWYPPFGTWWMGGGYTPYARPPYVIQAEANIPAGTVALEEGASVISADGKEIGDVERIFTEPEQNRATHLLIAEGRFLAEKKLVPTAWMDTVLEDEIHLSVDADVIDELPEYEA